MKLSIAIFFNMIFSVIETYDTAIVLHEDKQYYEDANKVYGDAEVLIREEDTQTIDVPIIKPIKEMKFEHRLDQEIEWPPTTYTKEFLEGLLEVPKLSRQVALIGHLHHGKTVFTDMLVHQTHEDRILLDRNERFTDTSFAEQERGLSIKSMPVSLILQDSKDKSHLLHLYDTPGHVNFSDEVTAALRICDGVAIVVDVVEGVMVQTERLIQHAVQERMGITLILNKFDRLILELKLPPTDAYHKLRQIIDEVNDILDACVYDVDQEKVRVSPELGNVAFASGDLGFSFTLHQFAQIYSSLYRFKIDTKRFAKRLWGEIFFDAETRRFLTKDQGGQGDRTFVQFVLEPLYKLFSEVVGEEKDRLVETLAKVGISLTKEEASLDVKPLLKVVCIKFFGGSGGLMDMFLTHIPSPVANASYKTERLYTGPLDSPIAVGMNQCDPKGPLMIHVNKLYPDENCDRFYAMGRILSGTLKLGERVKVLGESYTKDEDEDMKIENVTGLYLYNSRYKTPVDKVPAGNWVLIEGVDDIIHKTATITTSFGLQGDLYIIKPLKFNTLPVVKIAVEPLNPSELPKLINGLRKVNKTYPILITKVEDSGERIILGTGEMYLDCVMHDLRQLFTDIEIKVADPVTTFSETVFESSPLKCPSETPNKKNVIAMTAEPLEKGLGEAIEANRIQLSWEKPKIREWFQENYEWDVLAARSVWAFGPDDNGPNVLMNDTLPSEVDPRKLNQVQNFVIQGFQWASREGPLCEEPIRNTKFKILDATIADEPLNRTGTQIIPTVRRAVYSSFLTASPRLMEPVYLVEIIAPADTLSSVYKIIGMRRGHVIHDMPKPGTPLFTMKAYIPVIDSFGFETDIRTHTQGQAFCLSVFDHWAVVPGDPLDKSIVLRPLEPAPLQYLARDLMIKTRRRKGLSEDVNVQKFFDEDLLQRIKDMDLELF